MIFQVYDKTKGTPKPPVNITLKQDGVGIRLLVVDEQGYELNTLLRFNADGTISMAASVNRNYGFKQHSDGSIIIQDKTY